MSSGGIQGDMPLPPQFQQAADLEEAMAGLGEAIAEEGTETEEGSETKKARKKQETAKSEKSSTTTSASGDVIIAGVGGTGADAGGGGGHGGGQEDPSRPELAEAPASIKAISLEDVTSAMVAAIFALAMGDVAQGAADLQAGESVLNQLYRSMDSTIDQTNSKIMRNKLAEAKEKRIEAEEQASGIGKVFGAIMGCLGVLAGVIMMVVGCILVATIVLAPLGLMLQLAAVALIVMSIAWIGVEASGGMDEGGMVGGLCSMLGMEDDWQSRMVIYVIIAVVVTVCSFGLLAPAMAVLIASRYKQEAEVAEKQQEAKDLMGPTLQRNVAQNTPAAMKELLEEGGMESEMAEIMAYVLALLALLAAMLGGAGVSAVGAGGAAAGGAAAGGGESSGAAPTPEGGEGDLSGELESSDAMNDLGDDFGSFDGPERKDPKKADIPKLTTEEANAMGKDAAANIDISQLFAELQDTAINEYDYPENIVRDPAVEKFVAEFGAMLTEMVVTSSMLTASEFLPMVDYIGSLLQPDDTSDLGYKINTNGAS